MAATKRRKHSVIDGLPAPVKASVEQMLLSGTTYAEVVDYLGLQGVSLSVSAVCRYAQSFHASVEALQIAQENFRYMMTEAEKYPDMDPTEVLVRITGQNLLTALVSKSPEEWSAVEADKVVSQITGLTRAVAYKKRADVESKDIVSAALDEVKAELYNAMQTEQPETYRQLAAFLERKKKEGLGR